MTENAIQLIAQPHPFGAPVYAEAPAGQTLAQMLGPHASHSARVEVGGYEVPRALWAHVRPKAGQHIHITMFPQGGSGRKWERAVLMIVVAIVAVMTDNYELFGHEGVWSAVIAVGGSLLINALVPPITPKGLGAGGDPFQTLDSLTGTQNQMNPYGVIPCVAGSIQYFPPHAALPYTEISGNDQYLRMLLDLGYGDTNIRDIKIGETTIDSFEDVEYQIDENPTLFQQDVYELTVGATLVENTATSRTTQGSCTEISLDIVFAEGLYAVTQAGKTLGASALFEVAYQLVGDTTWYYATRAPGLSLSGGLTVDTVPLGNPDDTYSPDDPDPPPPITEPFPNDPTDTTSPYLTVTGYERKMLRCGARWRVPSGQYNVRVTLTNTSFNAPGPYAATFNTAVWSVLRSISPSAPSTTGTKKLAIRIKATDQLNGVVKTLSVLSAQKVRTWDKDTQAFTDPDESQNPAWIYLWLMTQCPAVVNRLADDRLDLDGIADWAAECDALGLKISFVMDSARAFGDIIKDVLAAGLASFGMRNGKYSPVRDIAQTVPVQLFTPANSSGFSYTRGFGELPHALRVQFNNPEANNQQDEVIAYADGYDESTATRFGTLDAKIVVDPSAAWRMGKYQLAVLYKRPNLYTFQCDIENIVCERGDLVHVAHDITGWGVAGGRVKAIDAGHAITANATPFGSPDGVTSQFQLVDANQLPVSSAAVTAIHQTDWQGRVELSSEPRTNYAPHSMDPATWSKYNGVITQVDDSPNPKQPAWHYVWDGHNNAGSNELSIKNQFDCDGDTTYYMSVIIKDGSASPYMTVSSLFFDTSTITRYPDVDLGDGWRIRICRALSLPAATIGQLWIAYYGQASPDYYVYGCMIGRTLEEVTGAYIPTDGSPVTVTDYTLTGSSVALGQVPDVGAVLDWDGSGTTGPSVTLDGPVDLEAGKTYAFRIRRDDNSQITETVKPISGSVQTLPLASALSTDDVGDLFVVGEVNRGVAQLIVTKIVPGDDLSATITAVDAAPDVWTAATGTPPTFVSNITGKAWCAPPPLPTVGVYAVDAPQDDAGITEPRTHVGSGNLGPPGGVLRPSVPRCVAVESFLPDGRRARDVVVGDIMALADAVTLAPRSGVVSYAGTSMQACVRIRTASASLVCSRTAPIPTRDAGLVLAPNLEGHSIAVRSGDAVRWEPVVAVTSAGEHLVRNITVENACFWAGEHAGAYILHHNIKNMGFGGPSNIPEHLA